jgi:hypothetical protein
MKLEQLREQIQEDLRTYLEDSTGSRRIIDNACQIVVDNFNRYNDEQ